MTTLTGYEQSVIRIAAVRHGLIPDGEAVVSSVEKENYIAFSTLSSHWLVTTDHGVWVTAWEMPTAYAAEAAAQFGGIDHADHETPAVALNPPSPRQSDKGFCDAAAACCLELAKHSRRLLATSARVRNLRKSDQFGELSSQQAEWSNRRDALAGCLSACERLLMSRKDSVNDDIASAFHDLDDAIALEGNSTLVAAEAALNG